MYKNAVAPKNLIVHLCNLNKVLECTRKVQL